VQEEPANMGAWPTMAIKLPEALGRQIGHVSLPASSAPAAGSAAAHAAEHQKVIDEALPAD
jgi:multifunctional 2-oxoglutarate metabolism enzyme